MPPVNENPIYGGSERREDEDVRVIVERLEHLREGQVDIIARLTSLEVASRTVCRDCQTWPRIAELEKQAERAKGMVLGVSTLIGGLWALLTFIASHWQGGK